ncbi:MAG TPA: hemolysin III family protein [Devosia sp.]|nr:hemolysin III family protein [Devosia sp.]
MRNTIKRLRQRMWWLPRRRFSAAELVADGIVHGVGLVAGIAVGTVLLALAMLKTAPAEAPSLAVYLLSLVVVLSVSMAYNLWPSFSPVKQWLARFDQAAIFLFIAGTYTPFLAIVGGATANALMLFVWSAAIIGIALKLIVPARFGRLAILLYLAIGWSGVVVFQQLAETLPPVTLWLLVAGGVLYSAGIIFHLWNRLRFQNALWHGFVVVAAMLQLAAIFDCMVINRL